MCACVCVYAYNKSDSGTFIDFVFNPRPVIYIYRINSTIPVAKITRLRLRAPSSAGRHSGHPGFLPFFIISVFFFLHTYIHIYTHTHTLRIYPAAAVTEPLFFIIYFPGFLYVCFVPARARGPWLYGKQMYPIYLSYIYTHTHAHTHPHPHTRTHICMYAGGGERRKFSRWWRRNS